MFKAAMVVVLLLGAVATSADRAEAGAGRRQPPAPLGKIERGVRSLHKGGICKGLPIVLRRQHQLSN
ncbi:MAG: hypothetical protein U1E76_14075 [Planctomycetota bacterium]